MTITVPTFNDPLAAFWWLLTNGGYIPIIIVVLLGIWWMYMEAIQGAYLSKVKYIFLAIDVPKMTEQTPKAVEHIFSHFHGIQKNPNWIEKYINGYIQSTITVELISINGFIQYVVRCPANDRDLVESAIYAQYPDAEIAEIEDYTHDFAAKFPNDKFDLWGCEVVLTNNEVYPIRTYPSWEHSLTQTFLDPLASLLEVMGRLKTGEQIWLQLILEPIQDNAWRERGLQIINKLAGIKSKPKVSTIEKLMNIPYSVVAGTADTVLKTVTDVSTMGGTVTKTKDEPPSMMMHLPTNTKDVIEAIGIKISKIGFKTKFRFVYIGEHEVFNKSRVSAVFGALKQYATMDLNGMKPSSKMKTARVFFMVKKRVNWLKRKIMLGYKYRSNWRGGNTFILNIEELASIWHFPVVTVKAPLVKKTEAKRGEPPAALPVGSDEEYIPKEPKNQPTETTDKAEAPSNLPVS